ncbi:MAG: hypothetical protein U0163_21100 [Gemmatimonadaceae bacterium]
MAAAFFALATLTRSMITTYIVALVVLMMYLLSARYFARLEYKDLVALLDPFGLSAFRQATERWTPAERNTLLPPLLGPFCATALWTAIACACLVVCNWYRPGAASARKSEERPEPAAQAAQTTSATAAPRPPQRRAARCLDGRPRPPSPGSTCRTVLRSPAYILLLGIAAMNAIVGLWIAGDDNVSITLPVMTRLLIKTLFEQYTQIPLVIAAYYAGELVWRDRERRVHEIVDATPAADWAFVIPKIIAIAMVLITMAVLIVGASVVVQVLKGYASLEIGHYVTWFMLPWVVTLVLYAVLAVFVRAIISRCWRSSCGLVIAAQLALGRIGLEHNLYQYAGTPPVPLSDMNGQGAFARHAAWFRVYWMAWATLLAVGAYALWRRGASAPLARRLTLVPSRLRGRTGYVLAGGALCTAAVGAFIFYNTNVVNEYRTSIDSSAGQQHTRRRCAAWQLPQPRITDITLAVDLYPNEPRVAARGVYAVENTTSAPLKRSVSWSRALEQKSFLGTLYANELRMQSLDVAGAQLTRKFPDLHYRIVQPAACARTLVRIRFQTVSEQRSFRNSSNETRVVANGTFIDNWRIALVEFNNFAVLQDRGAAEVDLAVHPPPLEDDSARAFNCPA